MVIIFGSEKARNQLLTKGIVATFRKRKRRTVDRDWATDKRGGEKITDVLIREVGLVKPSDLKNYLFISEFNTMDEWLDEILWLNRGQLPQDGYLYVVVDIHGKFLTETIPQLEESLQQISESMRKAMEPIYEWLVEIANDPLWRTLAKPAKSKRPELVGKDLDELLGGR